MDGEAAWAPPNDNCETYFILISTYKIMFHKGFLNLSPFKYALPQEVKKKKKKKKMRPYNRAGMGWGSCLGAPNENCKS